VWRLAKRRHTQPAAGEPGQDILNVIGRTPQPRADQLSYYRCAQNRFVGAHAHPPKHTMPAMAKGKSP